MIYGPRHYTGMNGIVFSDGPADGAVSLGDLGIRRCCGCVKCLTAEQGRCHIDDGFSAMFEDILGSEVLTFDMNAKRGKIPTIVLKAVERISNVLEAYTGSGGNIPLSTDSVSLRKVVFRVHGEMDRGTFERDMRDNLLKGPVESIDFLYD